MDEIRWAVLGPGNIAKKFMAGLAVVPNARLVAVASRKEERGKAFAEEHGADRSYDYAALAADDEIDAVYVATPHPFHSTCAIPILESGKAVLVEKPFDVNEERARRMVEAARVNDVFLMEAMWTRFLPITYKVREWIADGAIGRPRMVLTDFGFRGKFNPNGRLFNPGMGGGGLLDVGVYPISYASMIFGGEPIRICGSAEIGETGVDEQAAMTLEYDGGGIASLACGIRTQTPQHAYILGEEGSIHVPPQCWKATSVTLIRSGEEETVELPYSASGFEGQIEEVGRCLCEGKLESGIMPLDESLTIMRTMDELRSQWGVRYPME